MKLRYVPAFAAALTGLISTLAAQQPAAKPAPAPAPGGADPFIKGDKPPLAAAEPKPPEEPEPLVQLLHQGVIRAEYFSLPHTLARKMMRQLPQQTALYEWLGKELDNAQSEVKLERLSLLKARSGQRSVLQELNEYPYPTEFDSPQLPQSIGLGLPLMAAPGNSDSPQPPPLIPVPTPPPLPRADSAPPAAPGDPGAAAPPAAIAPGALPASRHCPPWPYTTATPSGFAFKEAGWVLEAEMNIGEDGHTVDLTLSPNHIKLVGPVPQTSNGEVAQPVFETHRLMTQILTVVNQPTLVGTVSPPVASGAPGGNGGNRTWLLFITVTPSR